jgi:hypothetical protein
MFGSKIDRDAVHSFARSSFCPRSREQAIAQLLSVAIERRGFNADSLSPFGINWKVAKLAIRKAKRVRDASDWELAAAGDMA